MAVASGPRDAAQIHAVHAGFVRPRRRGRSSRPGWWGHPARGSAQGEARGSTSAGARPGRGSPDARRAGCSAAGILIPSLQPCYRGS